MTLVLVGINSRFAVIAADCLLSIGNVPHDNEVIKSAVVRYADARLGLAFTGTAGVRLPRGQRGAPALGATFRTMEWLLDGVLETSMPDRYSIPSLERLTAHMSATWPLRRRRSRDRLLVVGFAGFRNTTVGIRSVVATISNYDSTTPHRTAEAFRLTVDAGPGVMALGRFASTVGRADIEVLGRLLSAEENRPAAAFAGKSIEIIRKAARSEAGKGVIGEICTSLTVPADPEEPFVGDFKTTAASDRFYQSHFVDVSGGPGSGLYMDMTIRGDQTNGTAGGRLIVFPRVADAALCTCGSGKRYRACHKRRKASRRRRARRGVTILRPYGV